MNKGLNLPAAKGQAGFTMIEISIGLVVVGLLLAGALKGSQFIASAKQKALLSQVDTIKSAVHLSAESPRVHGLLGDGMFEAVLESGQTQVVFGDSNGRISAAESPLALSWLRNLNLLSGDFLNVNNQIQNSYGGQTFIRTHLTRNDGAIEVCSTGIPAQDLIEISFKVDGSVVDGAGTVRGGPIDPGNWENSIEDVATLIRAGGYQANFTSQNQPGFMCVSI